MVSVEPVIIAAATRCLTLDLAAEEVQAGVADSGVGPLFWPDTPRVVVAFALALSPPCTVAGTLELGDNHRFVEFRYGAEDLPDQL